MAIIVARISPQTNRVYMQAFVRLLVERMALMKRVAAYKYPRRLGSCQPAREEALLARGLEQAQSLRLCESSVRIFQEQVMFLCLEAQEQWRSQWEATGFLFSLLEPEATLEKELRPRIQSIDAEILEEIALMIPRFQKNMVEQALVLIIPEGARRQALLEALYRLMIPCSSAKISGAP